jgi:hypothetical protein
VSFYWVWLPDSARSMDRGPVLHADYKSASTKLSSGVPAPHLDFDPDPLVTSTDPDPSLLSLKC